MWELFWTFCKIGMLTFGGGYAMIAQIRETVVARKGWLTEDELIEVIAVAESTPGPIAINMATFVGYKQKGFRGSLAATAGVFLPSLVLISILSRFLDVFMANRYVAYAFDGIRCAVAFLILKAGAEMLRKIERKPLPLGMFLAVLVGKTVFDLLGVSVSSVWFLVVGGAIGLTVSAVTARKGDSL